MRPVRTVYRRRMARKMHPACGGYCPPIRPGDVYLEVTELPGGESGYADSAGHPVRMAVCASCACTHGDWPEIHPVPTEQMDRYRPVALGGAA